MKQRPWEYASDHNEVTYENASLIDPSSGSVLRKTTFTVRQGKIVDVWTADDNDSNNSQHTKSQKVVNLENRFVCPGLIDCHVHLTATPGDAVLKDMYAAETSTLAFRSAFLAREMLLRGFTTVRDTGGADAGLRDSIEEGLIKGPRVFIAGKALSQTGGHGDFRARHVSTQHPCCGDIPGLSRVCDGVPQCLEAVRDEIRKGADFIKIMCGGGVATVTDPLSMLQFTPEEIRAITTTAAYSGKYVTAHAYTSQAIRHAVDNGVQGIEHGNFVDPETAAYLKEKNVVVTPTLVVYQAYELANKPPFDNFLPESSKAKNRQVLASGLESLKILDEAGVTMCYGSDLLSVLHPLQSSEFSIRSRVLSASSILKSATVNAAEYLGMQGKLGTIAPGAFADFVVLNENPLEDITVLDRVKESFLAIVKDGRVVASKVGNLVQDGSYHSFILM
uniref:WGS project CBMI000000000 data, contig CS3069_c001587 n=1 Tax=Fusarium clavum TaxID=2594811 RepID=A0A090MHY7_9HYPO|nr:unnamed protein product [Fusarium clavum]CEG05788.1 unnamed protein product [Fusarium clavum]